MNHRPLVLAAVAAAMALAGTPTASRADSISPNSSTAGTANYRLTTDHDLPVPAADSGGPQVVAEVVPPGTVIPPKQADGTEASPLTILKTSTGFDQNQLIVALKDNLSNATPGTTPEQLFGLSFFGSGFSKSGQLDFSLNIDKSMSTPPVLKSLTPGVTITALQTTSAADTTAPATTTTKTTTTTATSTAPVQAQVPEPMSVVLWSVLGGAGAWRARGRRRAA